MGNREDFQVEPSGEMTLTVVLPILLRLEHHVRTLRHRIDEYVPRRSITESVKERHRLAVIALGRRCPCCGLVDAVDNEGRILGEFDHFYSRERTAFEETWLICRSCHLQMRDRSAFTDEFRSYQRRAAAIEGGQLQLL